MRLGRPDRGNEVAREKLGDASGLVRSALGGSSLPPAASERLDAAMKRPGAVDGALLELLEDVTAAYYSSPPAALLAPVRTHLDRLLRLSAAASTPDTRRRSTALLSDAAAFAGWLSLDAARPADARAYLSMARDAAREAGDGALYWLAVASLALAHTNLDSADPKATTHALRQAVAQMPREAPWEARVWATVHAAKEHAAVGDDYGYRRYLEAAQRSAGGSQERPRLGGFFTSTGWFADVVRGEWADDCAARGLAFLGHPSAHGALRSAMASGGHARRRATLLATLSGYLAQRGEPEAAAHAAMRSLDASRNLPLWSERVRALRVRLEPWSTLPAVRELDEALAA